MRPSRLSDGMLMISVLHAVTDASSSRATPGRQMEIICYNAMLLLLALTYLTHLLFIWQKIAIVSDAPIMGFQSGHMV